MSKVRKSLYMYVSMFLYKDINTWYMGILQAVKAFRKQLWRVIHGGEEWNELCNYMMSRYRCVPMKRMNGLQHNPADTWRNDDVIVAHRF